MKHRPLLLVTNDDGVHAPGLRALADALGAVGEVQVVAPDREVSACSQSLTLDHPLRVETVAPGVHAVDGTPADCVHLALVELLPRRPDLVVSGINRGGNLGDDVFYSGTVGGAREGTLFGVPSVAVSLAAGGAEMDFAEAAAFSVRVARLVLDEGLPEQTLLNVNVPSGRPRGVAITVQGRREREGTILAGLDPRQRICMSDIQAVRYGLISVTPLKTDTTHHAVLAAFQAWEAALEGQALVRPWPEADSSPSPRSDRVVAQPG